LSYSRNTTQRDHSRTSSFQCRANCPLPVPKSICGFRPWSR